MDSWHQVAVDGTLSSITQASQDPPRMVVSTSPNYLDVQKNCWSSKNKCTSNLILLDVTQHTRGFMSNLGYIIPDGRQFIDLHSSDPRQRRLQKQNVRPPSKKLFIDCMSLFLSDRSQVEAHFGFLPMFWANLCHPRSNIPLWALPMAIPKR